MEQTMRSWLDDKRVIALLVVLSTVPLWWPAIPPLTDLPGHMGRYAVQLDGGADPVLRSWYNFDWALIGNLGIDLIVQLFGPIFGMEPVVKGVVMIIPALYALGLILVSRELHGRVTPLVLFALPLAYSYPFQFGFVNFSLSMALAWLGFALWLRLGRLGQLRLRALLFLPLGFLLWLCHIYGWATLCVFAFSAELVRLHRDGVRGLKQFFMAGINALPLAVPVVIMGIGFAFGGQSTGGSGGFFEFPHKILAILIIFRDRWQLFDFLCVFVLIAILIRFRLRQAMDRSAIAEIAFGLLALCYLLVPYILIGSAHADERLLPTVFAIGLVALAPLATQSAGFTRNFAIAGLLFAVLRIGSATVSYYQLDKDWTRELAALDHVPRNARLVSFVGMYCGEPWNLHRKDHLPGLALARRHAYSNDQWQAAGAQLLRVKYAVAGAFRGDPSQFVVERRCERSERMWFARALSSFPRDAFDYVWVINPPRDVAARYDGLTPVWRDGSSGLYKVQRDAAGSTQNGNQRNAKGQ